MHNSLKINRNNAYKSAYLIAFLLCYIFYNSKINAPSYVQTILTSFCITVFVIWMLNTKVVLKKLLLFLSILVIGFISYFVTHMSIFLLVLLAIILFDVNDVEKNAKVFFFLRFVSVLVIMMGALLGIISNPRVDVYKSGIHVFKYTFGFNHPNQFGQALGVTILMMILLCKKSLINYFGYIFCIIALYIFSGSRTAVICCSLFFIYCALTKNNKFRSSISKFILKTRWIIIGFILFLGIGLSVLMTKLSGQTLKYLYLFNGLLGSRYSYSSAVLNNYDISLFGNVFDFSYLETLYGNYAVDNSYINVLYGFGIIAFLILVFFSANAIKILLDNGKDNYAVLILVLLLWGCFENILFNPGINFGIFLLGAGKTNVNSKRLMVKK